MHHTTANITKAQPTTDREIAATKTGQEEIMTRIGIIPMDNY
jgi:hypothetical protein